MLRDDDDVGRPVSSEGDEHKVEYGGRTGEYITSLIKKMMMMMMMMIGYSDD